MAGLPELLDQIPEAEQIGTVSADGTMPPADALPPSSREAQAIIQVRKNRRQWPENCPAAKARTETRHASRNFGRALWKRWKGYHARSRIEANMRCLKAFGERISASDPDRQAAETHLRIALPNRFPALGTAKTVCVV